MKKLLSLSLILFSLLGGCNSATPARDVFVPDFSQSIDADAERQMFAAVEDAAQHLHRGDTLTIIPSPETRKPNCRVARSTMRFPPQKTGKHMTPTFTTLMLRSKVTWLACRRMLSPIPASILTSWAASGSR